MSSSDVVSSSPWNLLSDLSEASLACAKQPARPFGGPSALTQVASNMDPPAHSKGENSASIGICYEGGVTEADVNTGFDSRTAAQTRTMIDLIRKMQVRFPGAVVKGHRDMPGAATQCPGFNAGEWWDRVQAARANPASIAKSSTMQAAGGAAVAGATATVTAIGRLDPTAQYIVIGCAVFGALCLAWIARERIRKWVAGDR